MKIEFDRPEKKNWAFVTPLAGVRRTRHSSYTEWYIFAAIFCWSVMITISSDDFDELDEFMSGIFRRTNPQMWFCIIMMFILLLNLCL